VQRLRGSLSLLLFDMDDFSHWNRELGRDACDRLLRKIAKRTGTILRSYDLLGRVGKDEFLLALPGCGTANAITMAERLRVDVFGEPFQVKDGMDVIHLRLTACYAIAASHGRSPVVVVREAEQTLASAKQSGPDAIRCTSEYPPQAESSPELTKLFSEASALA
jgi:two-component system cell cycle response regulator